MTVTTSLLSLALFAALAIGAVPVEAGIGPGGGGGFHGGGGAVHGSGGGVHGGGGGVHGGHPVGGAGAVHGGGHPVGGGVHGGGHMVGGGAIHAGGHAEEHDHFHHSDGHGEIRERHFGHEFEHGFRFRPRFPVGFGIFLGYPFDYPFYDPLDDWAYPLGPLPYVAGQGYGGVSFSISPGDASVTVDGALAGTVDEFNDPRHPLNLPPGPHQIQIQAAGYGTLDFTVNVEAGHVIPYAGDLQPE